ncbi:MAG TPA: RNA polymerase sigma-70 factor [Chthonomonadaceae bacterium]|nr:RNA polymerase sigma-70 factor [Chthonomonadaceae bacterium]
MNDFESYRPLLFSIAYRMLGSVTEAEDMVQDTYLRYQALPPEQVQSPKALLSTIVTRLCLNQLESARVRRETYVGPWLPEPLLTGEDARTPADALSAHETISMAFLVLLESLTPLERAVFLLREVFDYEYAEIAEIIEKREAACRQIFHRAKQHVAEHRPRFSFSPTAHRQMLARFLQAVNDGEMEGLMQLLAEDVTLWADGGGKARGSLMHPLSGREAIARFMLASRRFVVPETMRIDLCEINGAPSAILRENGLARVVMTFEISEGQIQQMHFIANPDKIGRL